jgi:hypothetical protein
VPDGMTSPISTIRTGDGKRFIDAIMPPSAPLAIAAR